MKIEKIEKKEKESLVSKVSLVVFSMVEIFLAMAIIANIIAIKEADLNTTRYIGTLLAIAFIILAIIFALLRKGFIPEEVVTASK